MPNSRMGFLSRVFNSRKTLNNRIAELEAENDKLRASVRYEQARADFADKTDEINELKEQIKQLRAVLSTCAQVLSSAAKS